MLDPHEERAIAAQFGVATAQVRRDHLISHLLAVLSENVAEQVLFFGGTALSRSFVPDGRLSEDIDLIALGNRREIAEQLQNAVRRHTRREFPGLSWDPPLTSTRDSESAVLRTPDGLTVRIQLLRKTGYPDWPAARQELVQRYSDTSPATLLVPTIESFAAWKTVAWHNRAASRDLYDLWLLAGAFALTSAAADLFRRHGPTNKVPDRQLSPQRPIHHLGSANFPARLGSSSPVRKRWTSWRQPGTTPGEPEGEYQGAGVPRCLAAG